jgi:hypothetical protein
MDFTYAWKYYSFGTDAYGFELFCGEGLGRGFEDIGRFVVVSSSNGFGVI